MLRRKFSQTKLFRAVLVFLVLFFFVEFGPRVLTEPLRSTLALFFWPVEKFVAVSAFETKEFFEFFAAIGDLKKENERLEREKIDLVAEKARFADVAKENEVLRKELGLLPRDKYALKAAEVIGRDISGTANWITLDQGSFQGIKNDMAVIVGSGVLVGRVAEVFPHSSRVMLLSNPESLVNGIALSTDAKGIVKGEHGLGLLYDMILQSDSLVQGDTVVTSGLGGDMPKGLLVGTIQEPRFSGDRLFQRASLVSPIKFSNLRFVFIIQNIR